ncbi:MAG: hypothetical protein QM534_18190 [Sediminibacterium sp.]|nr:hypothetical protein [Sediminibacterium sp.]
MRADLAEKLLVKIMGWTSSEVSEQRPLLQALANLKYDEYQQFSPGIRFIESLVKWLSQFKQPEDKKTAYNFIINQLIFISNDQISHLVNITFSEKVNPILIRKTALKLAMSPNLVRKIVESADYKEILRRSLFIGVSDGSRIDLFRRSKREISNEQVFPSYYISQPKAKDMIEELGKSYEDSKFNSIFLIDDFTASGKSYFRIENDKPAGKIYKFLTSLFKEDEPEERADAGENKEKNVYKTLINTNEHLDIHIIFYIATRDALNTINNALTVFLESYPNKDKLTCSVDAVQVIEPQITDNVKAQTDFMDLISKEEHFDKSIVDGHYTKGKHDKPYLGFNECALPIILNHNTPNNSLPILWFSEDSTSVGLFPRVTRHKDE